MRLYLHLISKNDAIILHLQQLSVFLWMINAACMKERMSKTPYMIGLREKILDAAMRAFYVKGIKAVKMDDIAHSLSISKRTVYEIYDNKEVLLLEGVKKFKSLWEKRFEELYERTPDVMDLLLKVYRIKVEESKTISPVFYEDLVKYPSIVDFLRQDKQQAYQRFISFLKRGVEEGYFRNDIDLELFASSFNALIEHVMNSQLYRPAGIEHICHNVIFIYMRGLCTPEGVKHLDQQIDLSLSLR